MTQVEIKVEHTKKELIKKLWKVYFTFSDSNLSSLRSNYKIHSFLADPCAGLTCGVLLFLIMELVKEERNFSDLQEALPNLQLSLMGLIVLYGVATFVNHLVQAVTAADFPRNHYGQIKRSSLTSAPQEMFSKEMVNTVEMGFWLVRFVESYNSVYEEAQKSVKEAKEETQLPFSKVTSQLIKFSRYFLKYVTTFEKLLKSALKNK